MQLNSNPVPPISDAESEMQAQVQSDEMPPVAQSSGLKSKVGRVLRFKDSMTLQTKATLLAVALGTMPVLGMGLLASSVSNQSAARERLTTQSGQSQAASDKINRYLFERYGDVEILANLPAVANPNVRRNLSDRERQQLLEQFKKTYGAYENIALFDLQGRPVLQTEGPALEKINEKEYFRAVVKDSRRVISDPVLRNSVEDSSLYFAAPVRDTETGAMIGVMRTEIKLKRLAELLESYEQGGNFNVLDRSGQVIVASQTKNFGQPNAQVLRASNTLTQVGDRRYITPGLLSGSIAFTQLLNSEQGIAKASEDMAILAYGKAAPLEGMPDLGWEIAFADDVQQLLSAQRNLTLVIMGGTLLGSILITAIAAAIANRAIRPIKEAASTVEALGQGNLEQRVGFRRTDELGTLGSNINGMADRIQTLLSIQTLRTENAQRLNLMVQDMRQSFDKSTILNTAVNQLRQALDSSRVIVYEFDTDWHGTVIAEASKSGVQKILGEFVEDPFREGLIDRYRDGRVRVMNDIYAENLTNCHVEILEGFGIKASLTAPVIMRGTLVGLLCAHQCDAARPWSPEAVDLFTQVAIQLGFTLDQSALVEKQANSAERSQVFSEAVVAMRKTIEANEILQTAVEQALAALKGERAVVYRFNEGYKSGRIIAEAVAPGWMKIKDSLVEDPLTPDCIARISDGQVSVVRDVEDASLTSCHQDILRGLQVQANIVAPVTCGGQLMGLLVVHQCSRPRNWQPEEVDLMRQFGVQLGFALDQAALVQEQNNNATRWQGFTETIVQLRKSLNFNTILQTATDQALGFLKADRVVIYSFSEDWLSGTITAEAVTPGWIKLIGQEVNDPLLPDSVKKFRKGHVSVIDNTETAGLTACHKQILDDMQVQANVVVPVLRGGELIGLLAAHQCGSPRKWETQEVDLFRQIAVQLGFALDQAYLLDYTEQARVEARAEADASIEEQRQAKEFLQRRALELLMEVDPISKGDLTIRAKVTPDEVGTIADSYNATIKSLRQIVEQVQVASKTVAETAETNEEAVGALSEEAIEQRDSITEAIAELRMLINSIQGVAQRAQRAELGVQAATESIEAGDAAMNKTVAGISVIRETVAETSKKVKRLGEASQKISKVVNLISEFASQTNLLALNAAIEAARAGEEGRGFAVVAEEVRTLAQQSSSATADIEQLVAEIQTQTNDVVVAMEAGTEQVVTGTQLVEESRAKLAEISSVSRDISGLVREIAQAAASQTKTSTSVSQTMTNVAEHAVETSKQSETVADSFSHLLEVAKQLQVSVSQFKVK
jgi:methyl-accepting chemotaxis protein